METVSNRPGPSGSGLRRAAGAGDHVGNGPPALRRRVVRRRPRDAPGQRPAEVLLYDSSAASFPTALRNLSHFEPSPVRTTVLRSGSLVLHVWLIRLGRYYNAQIPH
ncbi:MAG TPA: hypothetical protein VMC83_33045 [Streptosporangiaceae bacterium]|nr:hypothetical protein [Streptosporangiaceae bacterium]